MTAVRCMFALTVLLLAAGAAARGGGGRGAGHGAAVAPTTAGRPAAASSASGQAQGPVPAHLTTVNPLIAGKPCVYTPAILPVWVDEAAFNSTGTAPLKSCTDKRLTQAQAAACLTCLSISSRRKCLAQTAATYHGTDKESCTWVGEAHSTRTSTRAVQEKQVRLSLGINSPDERFFRLAPDVCSVDISFKLDSRAAQQVYPMALMNSWLYGIVNGSELPYGLQSGGACLLKRGQWECANRVVRHKLASAVVLDAGVWTNSLAIVKALQRSKPSCADTPAGTCTAVGDPYTFDVLVTIKEQRCRRGSQPGAFAPSRAAYPFGQQGVILTPGGQQTDDVRYEWLSLDGGSRASWKVVSRYPIVVAATNATVTDSLCQESTDSGGRTVTTCDWTKLKTLARPGTYCLGTVCQASVKQDPALRDQQLLFAYPKYSYFADAPWIMNATETPAQTVEVRELDIWL